jgi:DNA end-binding protein Ku
LSGREQLALLHPIGEVMAMAVLNYQDQVVQPKVFEGEAPKVKLSAEEVELAESLVDASTSKKFDLGKYHDDYESDLRELIEAKSKGKKIAGRRTAKTPAVINLMDALRKSLGKARQSKDSTSAHRPSRRKTA